MSYSNRVSDRIVLALELAVKQEDKDLAKILASALEFSMTRNLELARSFQMTKIRK